MEAGFDRERCVVYRQILPAQKPLRCGREVIRKRVPVKVDGKDRAASNTGKRSQELDYLLVAEVVKEERREDEIEAVGSERQAEGIADNFGPRGSGEVEWELVQTGDTRVRV
jgi:hypothetical protein